MEDHVLNLKLDIGDVQKLPALLVPVPDAGRCLGLSRGKLYDMEKKGQVQFVRLGGKTLIRRSEIVRLAASAQPWRPDSSRSAEANAARRSAAAAARGQANG